MPQRDHRVYFGSAQGRHIACEQHHNSQSKTNERQCRRINWIREYLDVKGGRWDLAGCNARGLFVEAPGRKATISVEGSFRWAEDSPAAVELELSLAAAGSPEWSACFLAGPSRALSSLVVFDLAEAELRLAAVACSPEPLLLSLRARCSATRIALGRSPCLTFPLLQPCWSQMPPLLRWFRFRCAGHRSHFR